MVPLRQEEVVLGLVEEGLTLPVLPDQLLRFYVVQEELCV